MLKTLIALLLAISGVETSLAQQPAPASEWIRPSDERSPPIWGIRHGIVVGLWPAAIEPSYPGGLTGGPRGLLRIGYEYMGTVYLINYIAIEPLVDDDMEFSEVSPSVVDGKWGKLFWAADDTTTGSFSPYASARGTITHPDKLHPEIEQLTLYVFMEKFLDGANPYLRLSIRSDRPGELGIEIFNRERSAVMERCALTATMGNYSRLRLLYLQNKVIDAKKLFAGHNDIGFIEKDPYPADQMLRNKNGDFMAVAASDETLTELASWPQQPAYMSHWGWHYRPFYTLTQYWRVASADADSASLHVRVNGRAKYWSGDSPNSSDYIAIPNGPAFENFELRENYHRGQKFYFGLTQKTAKELIADE
jgi:hypothetical protein